MNRVTRINGCKRAAFVCVAFTWLLIGCAPNTAYHNSAGHPGNCVKTPDDDVCKKSYYQEFKDFDLAFAEFTERGNAFDNRYLREVLQRIDEKAIGDGVVLLAFIHGWKHNAAESDDNLREFKVSLQAVADLLEKDYGGSDLGKRRLVGVYVGWRGASLDLPFLINTTFWDRKSVAEEVGKGGVTRFLLDLDRTLKQEGKAGRDKDQNVMVVIGHSFGGAILISAMSEVLTERVINRTDKSGYARTVGDGVIVLNPAIEANQMLTFIETAVQQDHYRPEQYPLFISMSSVADSATHYAFPAGQTVGLLATWRQADLERDYFYDREKPDQKLILREEHLDATTVDNFSPFLTHYLTASDNNGTNNFSYKRCEENPVGCEPAGWTSLSGQPAIRSIPENYPLYFIRTDTSVMKGHNDIFNEKVRAFLINVINDVVARKLTRDRTQKFYGHGALLPTILNDPNRFEQTMNQTLERKPATQ